MPNEEYRGLINIKRIQTKHQIDYLPVQSENFTLEQVSQTKMDDYLETKRFYSQVKNYPEFSKTNNFFKVSSQQIERVKSLHSLHGEWKILSELRMFFQEQGLPNDLFSTLIQLFIDLVNKHEEPIDSTIRISI